MRVTTCRCDRCGCTVTEGGSIVAVKAGAISRQFTESLDFCVTCSGYFM